MSSYIVTDNLISNYGNTFNFYACTYYVEEGRNGSRMNTIRRMMIKYSRNMHTIIVGLCMGNCISGPIVCIYTHPCVVYVCVCVYAGVCIHAWCV